MTSTIKNLTTVATSSYNNNGVQWYTGNTFSTFQASGSSVNIPTNCTINSAAVYQNLSTGEDFGNLLVRVSGVSGGVVLGSQDYVVTDPTEAPRSASLTATVAQLNSFGYMALQLLSNDPGSRLYVGGYPSIGGYLSINFTMAAPTATTGTASNTTLSSATLNGTVNPNGATSAFSGSYKFQWGITSSYGNETTPGTGQTGSDNIAVSTDISGLTGNTTYHYRVVAYNGDQTTYGVDTTFLTAPGDPVGFVF